MQTHMYAVIESLGFRRTFDLHIVLVVVQCVWYCTMKQPDVFSTTAIKPACVCLQACYATQRSFVFSLSHPPHNISYPSQGHGATFWFGQPLRARYVVFCFRVGFGFAPTKLGEEYNIFQQPLLLIGKFRRCRWQRIGARAAQRCTSKRSWQGPPDQGVALRDFRRHRLRR